MSDQRAANSDWFEIAEVASGVWRVNEPGYSPDMRCNIYLIQGRDRDLVIDTGLGLGSLTGFLAGRARSPLLILSHAHYDHIGSAYEFAERWIHPAEAEIVAQPSPETTYSDRLLKQEDFSRLPWPGFDVAEWSAEPAPATGFIEEGDRIDLGDRAFVVLHTPGHSWGSICLWDEESGDLFCADTVYEGELFDFLPCSHVQTYVQSLRRLRELPVRIAFPGHGPLLTGPEFRRVIDAYLAMHPDAFSE